MNPPPKPKLTIGHFPTIDHLSLGVAQKNDGGFFEHFSLQTQLYRNWDKMREDLAEDKIDGAFLLFPLAMDMFQGGKDIKVLLLGQREGQALVVGNDINDIHDLKGKKILVPHRYSVHHILFYKMLKDAGMDPEKSVTYQNGFEDVREIPEILAQGKVQAFITAEPWITIAEKRQVGRIAAWSHDVHAHHICCVLVMHEKMIAKYPDACRELVQSLVKAGMFISAYPRQAAEIGEKFLESPRAILLEALTRHRGHVLFWDLLPRLEDFRELEAIAVNEMKLWPAHVDLERLIYPDFAQEAYRDWMIDTRRDTKDRGEQRLLPGNVAESAARLRSSLGGQEIKAAGIRIIAPGGKYPPHLEKLPAGSLDISLLEKALAGQEVTVITKEAAKKAVALVNPYTMPPPDFLLIETNPPEARRFSQALSLGQAAEKNLSSLSEEMLADFFRAPRRMAVLHQEKAWVFLSETEFRFLPLLLAYFGSDPSGIK